MLSRRAFIKGTLAGGVVAAVGGATYADVATNVLSGEIQFEQVSLSIPRLPSAFDGYRIGFLTDIHLGMWLPLDWIERSLAGLQRSEVNLLVLGGDYIMLNDMPLWPLLGLVRNASYNDLHPRDAAAAIYRDVARTVARYSFPDGTIAVAGNHDHWNFFPQFQAIFGEYPALRLLINQEFSVSRGEHQLSFFGVDDFLTGLPVEPPPQFRTMPRGSRIIVSHNPDYISALLGSSDDAFDLALCGHTHGGQVRVPGLGPLAVQIVDQRFASGLVRPNADQAVYTSRGLGVVGVPLRVGCPPEVTVITLRAA